LDNLSFSAQFSSRHIGLLPQRADLGCEVVVWPSVRTTSCYGDLAGVSRSVTRVRKKIKLLANSAFSRFFKHYEMTNNILLFGAEKIGSNCKHIAVFC